MAQTLGKRKRITKDATRVLQKKVPSPNVAEDEEDEIRARFQRAFEAKFKPLPASKVTGHEPAAVSVAKDQLDDDDDAFAGFSEDNEEGGGADDGNGANVVEIIEHGQREADVDLELSRREKKAFMSARPPTNSDQATKSQNSSTKDRPGKSQDDELDATNIKHDLALQRLLKESHLLDPSSVHASTPSSYAPQGKARLKALDLRLQDLGAKKTLGADVKMPMSHRKGISAKAHNREVLRRKEAAENGIILERPKPKTKPGVNGVQKRRDQGIGTPSVGKFRGGTLSLSSRDVRSISSGGASSAKRGKGRRK